MPSGGLYATYHLLGEPETTIDHVTLKTLHALERSWPVVDLLWGKLDLFRSLRLYLIENIKKNCAFPYHGEYGQMQKIKNYTRKKNTVIFSSPAITFPKPTPRNCHWPAPLEGLCAIDQGRKHTVDLPEWSIWPPTKAQQVTNTTFRSFGRRQKIPTPKDLKCIFVWSKWAVVNQFDCFKIYFSVW